MQGKHLRTLLDQSSGNINLAKICPEALANKNHICCLFFSGYDVALFHQKVFEAFIADEKAPGTAILLAKVFRCGDRYGQDFIRIDLVTEASQLVTDLAGGHPGGIGYQKKGKAPAAKVGEHARPLRDRRIASIEDTVNVDKKGWSGQESGHAQVGTR